MNIKYEAQITPHKTDEYIGYTVLFAEVKAKNKPEVIDRFYRTTNGTLYVINTEKGLIDDVKIYKHTLGDFRSTSICDYMIRLSKRNAFVLPWDPPNTPIETLLIEFDIDGVTYNTQMDKELGGYYEDCGNYYTFYEKNKSIYIFYYDTDERYVEIITDKNIRQYLFQYKSIDALYQAKKHLLK